MKSSKLFKYSLQPEYLGLLGLLVFGLGQCVYAQHGIGPSDTSDSYVPDVSTLILTQAVFGWPDQSDGFAIRAARIRLRGGIEERLQYQVQAELTRSPALLVAQVEVPLTAVLDVVAGVYKSPFSREFLVRINELPLAERSQVVRALVPGRQIGLTLRSHVLEEHLNIDLGIFNGNGTQSLNNDI